MQEPALPIRVGVSRCLLGDAVRYDGRDSRSAWVVDVLADRFELVPVCPEVDSGMPVPRPPVQLVRIGGSIRVRGVHEPGLDVTEALDGVYDRASERLSDLSGFVLKGRSPSCGLHDVPVNDERGDAVGVGSGRFAQALQDRQPALPIEEEERLRDPEARADFVARLLACALRQG